MSVGDSAIYSGESYIGIGRESTYGTYATATAGLDFMSASLKTIKDSKILMQVERKRTMTKAFSLGKSVSGDVEFYMTPDVTACAYILQNAFGGTVTSATATGETTGGSTMVHTFETGMMDQTYKSLSVNMRKGGTATGKVFEYNGGRIASLALAAAIDEPVRATMSLIFKDSTQTSNHIDAAMTSTAFEVLSFANGRFSVESSMASLTTTSFWHVQSINFSLNNSLKSDAGSRRIGTDTLDVLPPGVQSYELSVGMRFDTTTAYAAMLAATEYCAEFEFLGSTYSGSTARRGLKLQFQKLTVKDAGDPEIGGPDETLQATVTFNVLRDESASGYACRALLTSNQASI